MKLRENFAAFLIISVAATVTTAQVLSGNPPKPTEKTVASSIFDTSDLNLDLNRASRGDIRVALSGDKMGYLHRPVTTTVTTAPVTTPIKVHPTSKSKHYWHLLHLRHATLVANRAAIRARVHLDGKIPHVWYMLGQCESGGDARYGGPGGHVDPGYEMFEGYYNFVNSTWLSNGGGKYSRHAWGATVWEQTEIARNVLASEGPNAWPVCSKVAGLTRQNGM